MPVVLSVHSELKPQSSYQGGVQPQLPTLYFLSVLPVNDNCIAHMQKVYYDGQSAQIFHTLLFDCQGTN